METSPPPPPPRQKPAEPSEIGLPGGFGPLVKVLLVMLVLGGGFVFFRGRLVSVMSTSNPARQVSEIQLAMDRGDWETAAAGVRAARELNADDPAVMRVTAAYLDHTGVEPLLQIQILSALRDKGQAVPADALLEGRAHLRHGNLAQARKILADLPATMQVESEALRLKAAILAQEGEVAKARSVQQLANERVAADDPAAAFRRAVAALESPLPETRATGLADLWSMSTRLDAAALDALRFLVDRQDLTVPQAARLLEAFDKHPEHDLADHLSAVSALMRADPQRRIFLLDRETRGDPERSLGETMTLARWLALEKEHEKLMELAPQETLLQSKELFPIVLQSLAQSERWQEMHNMLGAHEKLPMPEEGILVWKALASARLNTAPDEATHFLKLAITRSQAAKNSSALRAAAQAAEDLQLWDLAYDAYSSLADADTGHELEMLDKCWNIAIAVRDLQRQLETARRQRGLRPTSVLLASRLDYLRLLLGDEIEAANDSQPEHASGQDGSVQALLQALKAYRLGDMQMLRQALLHMRDTAALSPGQRAVYAGLLAAAGETARAFQTAERIPVHGLAPLEKFFLDKAL